MANALIWLTPVLVFLIGSSHGNSVIVEKGQPTSLQCTFPNNETGITWQLMSGSATVNLSACSLVDNNCTDLLPSLYQASLSEHGDVVEYGLNVSRAAKMETRFSCLADSGLALTVNVEVYAWPKTPVCSQVRNDTYVEYRCQTANVFPDVIAVPHRREKDFTNQDFDLLHSGCTRGNDGAGTDGDYFAECKWMVPIEHLLLMNTIFVEMTPDVSNLSTIDIAPSVSDDLFTRFYAPEVRLITSQCPHGPDVRGDSIPIDKTAQCPCEISVEGDPKGYPRWFTSDGRIVGHENHARRESVLTLSYNYSDPDQTYECRPITPVIANVTSSYYTPKFVEDYFNIEIGKSRILECSFENNVSSITWQMLHGQSTYNVSTCYVVDSRCPDIMSQHYRGSISSSGRGTTASLEISSVMKNETQFLCMSDSGLKSNVTQLEAYAVPRKPECNQTAYEKYVQYSCTADNVYPALSAVLRLTGVTLDNHQIYNSTPSYSNGTGALYSASFYWRVQISPDMREMGAMVEVNAKVSNEHLISNTSAFSDNLSITFSVPEVIVNKTLCPAGPGVRGENIQKGTVATCRCELRSKGVPPGYARWLINGTRSIGMDDYRDGSSNLNITFNLKHPDDTYTCVPVTVLGWNVTRVTYKPKFVPNQTAVIHGFPPLVIILGVVYSGVVPHI